MDAQTASSLVTTLGLPLALLLLIVYAAWKIIPWVGNKVIMPVANEGVRLLGSLRENVETLTAHLKQQSEDIREVRDGQRDMRESQKRIEGHLMPSASSVVITPKEPTKP